MGDHLRSNVPAHQHAGRMVTLRVLSGTLDEPGTRLFTSGRGPEVDAFIDGDWVLLRWWEFAEPPG